jgi:hypothetical protein
MRSSTTGYLAVLFLGLSLLFLSCSGSGSSDESSSSIGVKQKDQPREEMTASSNREPSQTAVGVSREAGSPSGGGAGSSGDVPVIGKVSFDPPNPTAKDKVRAVVQIPEDRQDEIQCDYSWKVNGEQVFGYQEEVLDHPLKAGDVIEVEVTPMSRRQTGETIRQSVEVANSPPVLNLKSQHLAGDGSYTASVEASDPDEDSVTFSLAKAPGGMAVDPQTGHITWSVASGDQGTFDVQVAGKDSHGAETLMSYQIQISWQEAKGEADNDSASENAKE